MVEFRLKSAIENKAQRLVGKDSPSFIYFVAIRIMATFVLSNNTSYFHLLHLIFFLMDLIYNQPLPASLNTNPAIAPVFPINIGQICRLLFMQPFSLSGTQFATMADAQTMSNWTSLIAATDSTAVLYTPIMSNTKIGAGKPLETATDSNLTFFGQPEFFGISGSGFTGEFRAKDAPSIASLQYMPAFSAQGTGGQSNLSVFMLNQNGDVICSGTQSGTTITNIQPINIFSFWYAGMSSEGYATGTVIPCGLWLPPGWSDNLVVVPSTPTFDLRLLA